MITTFGWLAICVGSVMAGGCAWADNEKNGRHTKEDDIREVNRQFINDLDYTLWKRMR